MNPLAIKPLNLYPVVPMEKDTQQIMLALLTNPDMADLFYADVKDTFPVKVCEKRCEVLDIKIDKATLVFVSTALSHTPAEVVMYLHAIYQDMVKRGSELFTFSDLCFLFPAGFPAKDVMSIAWDAQKGDSRNLPGGNLIDSAEHFKAIYEA